MAKSELILIPWPLMGHLGQLVEFAKLLLNRASAKEGNFSIKILLSRLPDSIDPVTNTLIDSLISDSSADSPALEFITLPHSTDPTPEWTSLSRGFYIQKQLDSQKPQVKNFIQERLQVVDDSRRILGIVVDMFSTCMIDVADDLGLPSYVFFTSGAAFFGLMLHFQELQDEQDIDVASKFSKSDADDHLTFPTFVNPVPPSVLPIVLTDEQLWLKRFLPCARGYKRAEGILINTFSDLESYAIDSLIKQGQNVPRIYPIGPVLNRAQNAKREVRSMIMKWLDEQPPSSVIYISFGSLGSLEMDQVKELAIGLERSGYRFLWVLRRPPAKNTVVDFPTGYDQFWDILPEGFSHRTESTGKVVGWAPQLEVLSHEAVGGFISHCGWNSTLESIWCGVPLATWPLNSEQQLNAFQLVIDLGLSVEISLDYSSKNENQCIIAAEEIERAVRKLMSSDCETRKKVIEMRDRSRASMDVRGFSYEALESFIYNMMLHN